MIMLRTSAIDWSPPIASRACLIRASAFSSDFKRAPTCSTNAQRPMHKSVTLRIETINLFIICLRKNKSCLSPNESWLDQTILGGVFEKKQFLSSGSLDYDGRPVTDG